MFIHTTDNYFEDLARLYEKVHLRTDKVRLFISDATLEVGKTAIFEFQFLDAQGQVLGSVESKRVMVDNGVAEAADAPF